MSLALAILTALPCLQQNATDEEAAQLLLQFRSTYDTRGSVKSEGVREGALTILRSRQHPRLLERLIAIGDSQETLKIRTAVAEALGDYHETQQAGDALVRWLKNPGRKDGVYALLQKCLESLGRMKADLLRPHRQLINDFISHSDGGVAKAAVMAATQMKHRDSIQPLISEMKRCQADMLTYMQENNVDGCDGG